MKHVKPDWLWTRCCEKPDLERDETEADVPFPNYSSHIIVCFLAGFFPAVINPPALLVILRPYAAIAPGLGIPDDRNRN